jgi:myosin heavy subunit
MANSVDPTTAMRGQLSYDDPAYASATAQTYNARQSVKEAQQNVDAVQKDVDLANKNVKEAQSKVDNTQAKIDSLNDSNDRHNSQIEHDSKKIDENRDKIQELGEKAKKLQDDKSPIGQKEYKKTIEKMHELNKENNALYQDQIKHKKAIAENNKKIEEQKKQLEKDKRKLKDAELEKESADKEMDDAQDKLDEAQDKLDDAKKHEEEVAEEESKKYPDTFGKKYKEYKNKKKEQEEERKKKEEEKKKKEEEKEKEKERQEYLSENSDGLTKDQIKEAKGITDKEQLENYIRQQKLGNQIAADNEKIEQLKKDLLSGDLTPAEKQKKQEELLKLEKDKKALEKELKHPNEETQNFLDSLLNVEPKTGVLLWDSPSFDLNGRLEDIIAEHMQPKLKFAYIGEFPEKLKDLDWMVKSMDKPKVNIEYAEQIRSNVMRYYPIKMEHGELSVTFWDDMKNKTINAIYNYFKNDIYKHESVEIGGQLLLRDSIVIPKFSIYELVTDFYYNADDDYYDDENGEGHLKYTFENASISSFDFDNSEDESDDGTHTIQAVFKIERFTVEPANPRALNPMNNPKWL